jgi:anthranilate synthase/aminodeoxychorismate synthase-like glutamine amidotransferase
MASPAVLVLDHRDSFTWNLVHLLAECGAKAVVLRAEESTLADLEAARPGLLVLSPGPGHPRDSQLAQAAARAFAGKTAILGVCLGMQAIALAFGGAVEEAPAPVHGKVSSLRHDGSGLFQGVPSPLKVARYHSLAVTRMPAGFQAQAFDGDGVVMALRHPRWPLAGVQFHPESFLTEAGRSMMAHALRGDL